MLTDREVEDIERGRKEGLGGPLVLTWVDKLLQDRRERVQQLDHLRQRLDQAFRYLDGLVRAAARPQAGKPSCPKCGRPYERASGQSPRGVVYQHSNGKECRT